MPQPPPPPTRRSPARHGFDPQAPAEFGGRRIRNYRRQHGRWMFHPVFREGFFTRFDIPAMVTDPAVALGLTALHAPIWGAQFEVAANSPEVKRFVETTLHRIWQHDLPKILNYLQWGTMFAEILYEQDDDTGLWQYAGLDDFELLDVQILRRGRRLTGARVAYGSLAMTGGWNVEMLAKNDADRRGGTRDWNLLRPPKLFAVARNAFYGDIFGRSVLETAWNPWMEKCAPHGAVSVRKLWAFKCAFTSGVIFYPPGGEQIDDSGRITDNQDRARELGEKIDTGAVVTCPQEFDDKGNRLWDIVAPQMNGDIHQLLDYPDKLDVAIWRGMGILDEVLQAGDTGGGWSGRSVPLLIFLNASDQRIREIATAIDVGANGYTCKSETAGGIIRPLVLQNYGPKAKYAIRPVSLVPKPQAPNAAGMPGEGKPGGGKPADGKPAAGGAPAPAPAPTGGNPAALMGADGMEQQPLKLSTAGGGGVDLPDDEVAALLSQGFDSAQHDVHLSAAQGAELPDEPGGIPGPVGGGRWCAETYAQLWNAAEARGEEIDPAELETVAAELAPTGWIVERIAGEWVAYPAEGVSDGVSDGVSLSQARSPRGGVTIRGTFYAGGRFIPAAVLEQAPPEVKRKVEEAQTASADRRTARGSVDTEALRGTLEAHGHHELDETELKRARQGFAAIKRHHGDLSVHRLDELAGQLQRAYDALPEDEEGQREQLGKRLRAIGHMLDVAHEQGITGEVQEERKQAAQRAAPPTPAKAAKAVAKEIAKPAPPGEAHPWKGGDKPDYAKAYNAPVDELHVDPDRFQFKLDATQPGGVTGELKGIEHWNPNFAGVVSVWRDPEDGKTYVVNGHHRRELAGRLGVKDMAVRYLDAPDAKQARATGALINIAEGRGTAVDAAKFMRDTGSSPEDLANNGVSLKAKLAADATVLTRLNDRLFDRVARGTMDQGKALAIAKHLDEPVLQDKLAALLDKREDERKDISPRIIEEMALRLKAAGTIKNVEEGGLFGDIESEESLFEPRAELAAFVRGELAKERNDFGAVASKRRADVVGKAGNVLDIEANRKIAAEAEQAKNVYDTLVNRKGPISDALNESAAELARAKGKKQRDAIRDKTLERVRSAVQAELAGESAPGEQPGADAGGAGAVLPGSAEARGSEPAREPGAGAADGGRSAAEPGGLTAPEVPAASAAPAAEADQPSPVGLPDPSAVSVNEPRIAKDGTTWMKAPAGGLVSPVNGQHYKGGQWMPIHGRAAGLGSTPAGESQGEGMPLVNENGEGGKPRRKTGEKKPSRPERTRDRFGDLVEVPEGNVALEKVVAGSPSKANMLDDTALEYLGLTRKQANDIKEIYEEDAGSPYLPREVVPGWTAGSQQNIDPSWDIRAKWTEYKAAKAKKARQRDEALVAQARAEEARSAPTTPKQDAEERESMAPLTPAAAAPPTTKDIKATQSALKAGKLGAKGDASSPLITSDLTGLPIRRHVELPSGHKVHPDELARATEGEGGKPALGPENIAVSDPLNNGQDTQPSFERAIASVTAYKGRDDDRVTLQSPHGYSVTRTRGEWRALAKQAADKPEAMAQWYDRENPEPVSAAAKESTAGGATLAGAKESEAYFAPRAEAGPGLYARPDLPERGEKPQPHQQTQAEFAAASREAAKKGVGYEHGE